MYGIEDMGLVKIDLLSQRSLEVLTNTMNDLEAKFISTNHVKAPKIIPINSFVEK
jgi:DNA polymerase III alpha subunit